MNQLKFLTSIVILWLLTINSCQQIYNINPDSFIKFNITSSSGLFDDRTVFANWSNRLKSNIWYKWNIQKMDLNDYWNNTFFSIDKFLPFFNNQNSIEQGISLNLKDNPPQYGNLNDNWSIFYPIKNWVDFKSFNSSNQLTSGLIIFIIPQTVTNKSTELKGSDLISMNYNNTLQEIQKMGFELNYNSTIYYFSKMTNEEQHYSWEYEVFNNAPDRSNRIVLINITLNYNSALGLLKELWLNIGGTDHTDSFYMMLENNSATNDTQVVIILVGIIIFVIFIIYCKKKWNKHEI